MHSNGKSQISVNSEKKSMSSTVSISSWKYELVWKIKIRSRVYPVSSQVSTEKSVSIKICPTRKSTLLTSDACQDKLRKSAVTVSCGNEEMSAVRERLTILQWIRTRARNVHSLRKYWWSRKRLERSDPFWISVTCNLWSTRDHSMTQHVDIVRGWRWLASSFSNLKCFRFFLFETSRSELSFYVKNPMIMNKCHL